MFTHITFSTGKSFLKKFLGNGMRSVRSVKSIVFVTKFSAHFRTLRTLRVGRARLFGFENTKPVKNTIGDLP